jgi:AcrR family transcriptional regulator
MRREPGETREAILDATIRLLGERRDADKVTIDAVVGEVGCTPPTLYHYFPTKQDLLLAACQREYQQFAVEISVEGSGTGSGDGELPSALEALEAMGHAYLDWAVAHPTLYELLFMTRLELGVPTDLPAEATVDFHESPGLAELIDALERARDEGALHFENSSEVAFVFWAMVHGFASLGVSNPEIPGEFLRAGYRRACQALIVEYG